MKIIKPSRPVAITKIIHNAALSIPRALASRATHTSNAICSTMIAIIIQVRERRSRHTHHTQLAVRHRQVGAVMVCAMAALAEEMGQPYPRATAQAWQAQTIHQRSAK